MCIYIYIYIYRRLGVLVRLGICIRFVRACVRAKLRVAAGCCCFRGGVSKDPKVFWPGLVVSCRASPPRCRAPS